MAAEITTRRNAAICLLTLATAATLYSFPPADYHFYPVCLIHQFTGLLCPGCGATRAMAALLHGHVQQAIHLNALFVFVMLPISLLYIAASLYRSRWLRVPVPAMWAFAVVALTFAVARNAHWGVG